MHHIAAIAASLLSFGLVCAIYYCDVVSRPGSWLRGELTAMLLTAFLAGFLVLAVVANLMGLWEDLAEGFASNAVLSTGIDLAGFAVIAGTVLMLRAVIKANDRIRGDRVA